MLRILFFLCSLTFLFACSKPSRQDPGPDNAPETVPFQTERGATAGAAVTAVIGAAGGELASADGSVKIKVPAGAVAGDKTFSIQPVDNMLRPGKPDNRAFRLLPEDAAFAKPVMVTFKYAPEDITAGAEDVLRLAYQTVDGHWKSVPAALDKTRKTLSADVSHFCDFAFYEQFELFSDKDMALPGETVNFICGIIEVKETGEADLLAPLVSNIPDEFDRNEQVHYLDLTKSLISEVKEWKVVEGPGTVKGIKNRYNLNAHAEYKAPASITDAVNATVQVELRGAVNIPDPGAPGGFRKLGQLFLRKTIRLVPTSYMRIQVDGMDTVITDALLAIHLNGLTSITGIHNTIGVGAELNISAGREGGFSCGDITKPSMALVRFNYDVRSVPKIATSIYCISSNGTTETAYSGGQVSITKFGAIGDVVEGAFSGALYQEKPNSNGCEFIPKNVTISFRILRTGG